MRQFISFLVVLFLVASTLNAQEGETILFGNYSKRLPKPLPTTAETMAAYGSFEQMEKDLKTDNKLISDYRIKLYAPIFPHFKKLAASNSTQLALYSKEEREFVWNFKMATNGLDDAGMLMMLALQFELSQLSSRPLISSQKFSWTKLNPAASSSVKKLYQRILEVEKWINWKDYSKKAYSLRLDFGGVEDATTSAISKKFEEALDRLPKKKVKVMEGFYKEIGDPDKAILLWTDYNKEWQKSFAVQYSTLYNWWSAHFEKLSSISENIDAIANDAGLVMSSEADKSLLPILADLQARTWEAWIRLQDVTIRLFVASTIAEGKNKQTEEAIEMYKLYKADTE